MKKIFVAVPVAMFFLTTAAFAQAQGCVDSPENGTAVLGIIAVAASFGFIRLLKRASSRAK